MQVNHTVKKTYPKEVYLNGEWLSHDRAFVSVFDRGFLFGDGIYEVTPFYKGKPFLLQEHIDRLQYSLDEIQVELDASSFKELMISAVSRAGLAESECAVYIQVSRGVAPRTHFFPKNIEPTVLLYAFPVGLEGFQDKKVPVLVSEDLRWHRCDIKSTSLLANVKANDLAHKKGLHENILFRNGCFTEGSHSTIFFVQDQKIFTHPEGPQILSGITRNFVIPMARELGYEVVEKPFPLSDLNLVTEVFLTGTTTQILAVDSMVKDDEVIFTAAEKGPVTTRLQETFIDLTRNS